jgi:hypothetical protein
LAADDRGRENGDRCTHIPNHNPRATPARNHVLNPMTRYKSKRKNHNTKNTRANMTIASLNMRGRYSNNGTTDKWRDINQLMKESKINMLAIQEAHLKQDEVDDLHTLSGTH